MSDILVAGALQPSVVNTPLDKRTRIAALTDVSSIENPYLGMIFYCTGTAKHYKVTALKAKTVGALTVQNAQIDTYTEFGGTAAIAISDVAGLQNALDGKASSDHTHAGTASSVTTLVLTKPQNGIHLLIKRAGSDGTLANATTVIDTLNTATDRTKVKGFLASPESGSFVQIPADGFGSPYDGAAVSVDLSALADLPAILYVAWYTDSTTLSDTIAIVFPSCTAGAIAAEGGSAQANTLSIGTVTTGTTASASITGTAPNQVLNLVLPNSGGSAQTNTLSIGTVTTGTTASASITGTAPNQVLNLVLPNSGEKGDKGDKGNPGEDGDTFSVVVTDTPATSYPDGTFLIVTTD